MPAGKVIESVTQITVPANRVSVEFIIRSCEDLHARSAEGVNWEAG
jgi:hypothetical protein